VFTGPGLGSGVGLGLAEGDGLEDGILGEGEVTTAPAGSNGPSSIRQAANTPAASARTRATGQKGIRERAA
jgi:hypothetical protein